MSRRSKRTKRFSHKFSRLIDLVRNFLTRFKTPDESTSKEPRIEEINLYHLAPEQFSVDDVKRLKVKFHKKGLTIKELQKKLRKAHYANQKFHKQVKELKARISDLEATLNDSKNNITG